VFVSGKVGFENFSVTNNTATAGFTNSVGLSNGSTQFAVYPGGGFEAFAGPIGVRAEVGDDIYFLNGAHNNLRASLGPQFRFQYLSVLHAGGLSRPPDFLAQYAR
jgi:hypothetical protein